jgi:hypothetical protein
MYDTLQPGDVVLADALFDNYFLACELRDRGIDLDDLVPHAAGSSRVARNCPPVGTRTPSDDSRRHAASALPRPATRRSPNGRDRGQRRPGRPDPGDRRGVNVG